MAKRNRKDASPKIGEGGAALTDDRKKQLGGYVTEIERWIVEKKAVELDIKAIYESAKDAGFHTKAIRHIVKERAVEKDKREAFEAVVDVYKHALGMLSDLPLGQAATTAAATAAAAKVDRRHKPRQVDLEEAIDRASANDASVPDDLRTNEQVGESARMPAEA